VKVVAGEASVAQFIASLKVALSAWVMGTPVAPFAATVFTTAGGGGGAATVVKLHVYPPARKAPFVASAWAVIVAE
jgi:hypothetical protein